MNCLGNIALFNSSCPVRVIVILAPKCLVLSKNTKKPLNLLSVYLAFLSRAFLSGVFK